MNAKFNTTAKAQASKTNIDRLAAHLDVGLYSKAYFILEDIRSEHAALVAVAEAAKLVLDTPEPLTTTEHFDYSANSQRLLESALANLAAVRGVETYALVTNIADGCDDKCKAHSAEEAMEIFNRRGNWQENRTVLTYEKYLAAVRGESVV